MPPMERTSARTFACALAVAAAVLAAACGKDPVEPIATTMTVSPASVVFEALAETVQLTATVEDQNGETMSGITITWSSGDAMVATVRASGLVTAAGNGAVTVTAAALGLTGTVAVTVAQRPVELRVSPEEEELAAFDATVQLSAEVSDANGHAIDDVDLSWSSDDETVVTVDTAGLVTAVGNGVATIEASAEDVSGTAEVTVAQQVAQVRVSPEVAVFAALGDTIRLSAEAADANGHVIEGVEFMWSSEDESVAAVDAAGLVTAAGNGQGRVRAAAEAEEGFAIVRVELHRLPLLMFYEALGGPDWNNNENWGTDAAIGTWHGVSTNVAGYVTKLQLTRNGLTGSIPPEIGMLETLQDMSLHENSITGPIPAEIGNLPELTVLDLWRNRLTGSIPPELGNLENLELLVLWDNRLTGSIPPELGNFPHLDQLNLSYNQLTGPIPPELGNLGDLETVYFSENKLTGAIPPELANPERLYVIHVRGNDAMSGPLPLELTGLVLDQFHWYDTNLCAPVDDEFQEWLESIDDNRGGENCEDEAPPESG